MKRNKRALSIFGGALAFVLLSLLVTACGSAAGATNEQTVTVTATDYKFQPDNLTFQQGKKVKLVMTNKGTVEHNLTIVGMPATDVKSSQTGDSSNPNNPIDIDAQPGQSTTIEFTPSQSGTYQMICDEPGHVDLGMTGTVTVQ